MRLIFSTLLIGLWTVWSLPADAADPGTYRPGQAYFSVAANNPDQCHQQCIGDAQCKGWNFVQTRAPQNHAICEFNARKASPVPHPMSISGDNKTASDSARIIPAGYRTKRVGHPVVTKRIPTRVMRVGHSQNSYTRPTAQQPKMIPAMSRSVPQIAPPPNPALYQLKPHLDVTAPVSHQIQSHPSSHLPRQAERTAPQAPSFRPHLDTTEPPTFPARNLEAPNVSLQAPDNRPVQPQPTQMQNTKPSVAAPRLSELKQGPITRNADPRLAGPPVSTSRAQQSLFGSLYDDVKVPRALGAADIPVDPDAPIPTVSSVPVTQIDQSPL